MFHMIDKRFAIVIQFMKPGQTEVINIFSKDLKNSDQCS